MKIPDNEKCPTCKGSGRRPQGPRKKRGPKGLDPAKVEKLEAQGLSVAEIAEKLGKSRQAIYNAKGR